MGRFAQQHKRGGHVGPDPGLPAGPTADQFYLEADAGVLYANWIGDGPGLPGYFRSRWRRPAISDFWMLGTPVSTVCLDGQQQVSPFPAVSGQQQDCELIFCDALGNVKSQWSAFQFLVPS